MSLAAIESLFKISKKSISEIVINKSQIKKYHLLHPLDDSYFNHFIYNFLKFYD